MTPDEARKYIEDEPGTGGMMARAIAAIVLEARLIERERCAVIAELAATHALGDPCRIIAQRIRIDPAKGE